MEQRTILELILGVYKLDKKYRSRPIKMQKSRQTPKQKYKNFVPVDYLNDSSDSEEGSSSSNPISEDEVESSIETMHEDQDYSDSDDYSNLSSSMGLGPQKGDYIGPSQDACKGLASLLQSLTQANEKMVCKDTEEETKPLRQSQGIKRQDSINQQSFSLDKSVVSDVYSQRSKMSRADVNTYRYDKQVCLTPTLINNPQGRVSQTCLAQPNCKLTGQMCSTDQLVERQLKLFIKGLNNRLIDNSIDGLETTDTSNNQERRLDYLTKPTRRSPKDFPLRQGSSLSVTKQGVTDVSQQISLENPGPRSAQHVDDTVCSKQKQRGYYKRGLNSSSCTSGIPQRKAYDFEQLLKVSNIGLIQHKLLSNYLDQVQVDVVPYHLYFPQADSSLQQIIVDYVIQAYSYDFSVVRVQQNNIMIRLSAIVARLVEDFELSREDEEIVEQIQQTILQIEKRNQEIRVKTMFCCNRVMQNYSEKFVICNNCGRLCNYQKKSIRKDRSEGVQRNTSYHSIRHFDDVFKQLFIQPLEPIDSITKLQLQEFMERDHKQKVNIEDVRQYLKQLPGGKGSKLNKSDAFIMGLLNGETLKISNIEYQFIKNTFQQFIQILYKNAETRKNTPNCVSFIRKIIDLLYKDLDPARHQQIVKRLHQQKENTTRKMQKTWQFLLSQFDVARIKQEFRDTIKSQSLQAN